VGNEALYIAREELESQIGQGVWFFFFATFPANVLDFEFQNAAVAQSVFNVPVAAFLKARGEFVNEKFQQSPFRFRVVNDLYVSGNHGAGIRGAEFFGKRFGIFDRYEGGLRVEFQVIYLATFIGAVKNEVFFIILLKQCVIEGDSIRRRIRSDNGEKTPGAPTKNFPCFITLYFSVCAS
jgi:hypothetical protein